MILEKKVFWQIIVQLFVWMCYYAFVLYPFISFGGNVSLNILVLLAFTTVMAFLNYYILVPQLLLKRSIWVYVLSSAIIILVAGVLVNFLMEPEFVKRPPPLNMRGHEVPFFRGFLRFIIVLGIPFIISALLKVYVVWKKNEDLRKIVENEKVHSELRFLKTQLNPHFLFNSLNTIYALSVKKSADTSEAIISLSELMRYMLYEANKDFAPLHKELEYIQNYVQLQRLRLSNSENVHLKISGEDKGKIIPPLLFISFIENAFKYGTDFQGVTNVKINLIINSRSIHLYVWNKIGSFKKKTKSSGVGLQNIRNRLNLLYPDSHELKVQNSGEEYTVNLTLNL